MSPDQASMIQSQLPPIYQKSPNVYPNKSLENAGRHTYTNGFGIAQSERNEPSLRSNYM